jgi:hypothetical protein
MGTSIAAIIPIVFTIERSNYFHDDYFEAFDLSKKKGHYQLKPNLLFKHFREFFIGFNNIIENTEETWVSSQWEALDEFAKNKDYKGYLNYLADNSNMSVPFYENSWGSVSVLGMEAKASIVFYSGSYKADLEEYSTLSDMEKLLRKAFDNPLSKIAKFCIFG